MFWAVPVCLVLSYSKRNRQRFKMDGDADYNGFQVPVEVLLRSESSLWMIPPEALSVTSRDQVRYPSSSIMRSLSIANERRWIPVD